LYDEGGVVMIVGELLFDLFVFLEGLGLVFIDFNVILINLVNDDGGGIWLL